MTSNAPRLSVIVPVHNAEAFLRPCVTSLQAHAPEGTEILLVDDGSTDGSRAIAGELAACDGRIRVLEQPHVGPGAARNRGLEHATAPYVTFVDSDDLVLADGLAALVRRAEESGADVVVAKTLGSRRRPLPRGLRLGRVRSVRALYTGRISMSACAKLYRRSFLSDREIRFPPTQYIEDRHFLLQAFVAEARIAAVDREVYERRIRPDSTMRRIDEKHIRDATAVYALDLAVLERAGLAEACGGHMAWATLVVDLYLARAIRDRAAGLHAVLVEEVRGQQSVFRRLPTSLLRRALLAGTVTQLLHDLETDSEFLRTRFLLRLTKSIAL